MNSSLDQFFGDTSLQVSESRFSFPRYAFVADACIVPDEEQGFWACVPTLPGVISEGDTENEAWANIAEALTGALHSYIESGSAIPWQETADIPPHAKCRRIAVHVPIADDHRP